MTRIPFWKLQAIGNDFPLVHETKHLPDLSALAIAMADRRFGIGGDGLLTAALIEPGRVRLRMFNPDGTEDFCGNGLRCGALHVYCQGWVGESFMIEHLGREVPVTIGETSITTVLGGATYVPEVIPLNATKELFRQTLPNGRLGSTLSTGSAHTIVWVDALPDDATFFAESPALEHAPLFPERTSVMWTERVEENHLRLRIWERGVGETQGCGTGSTAAAVDYLRGEGRSGRVRVDNPGGTLHISWDREQNVTAIEGQAHEVFSGEFLYSG